MMSQHEQPGRAQGTFASFLWKRLDRIDMDLEYNQFSRALDRARRIARVWLPKPSKNKFVDRAAEIRKGLDFALTLQGCNIKTTVDRQNRYLRKFGREHVEPFVSDLVDELWSRGYLEEKGRGFFDTSGGKKSGDRSTERTGFSKTVEARI